MSDYQVGQRIYVAKMTYSNPNITGLTIERLTEKRIYVTRDREKICGWVYVDKFVSKDANIFLTLAAARQYCAKKMEQHINGLEAQKQAAITALAKFAAESEAGDE